MIDAGREQRLARLALDSGLLEKRSAHWEKRYRGLVKADELWSLGNAELLNIVRGFKEGPSGFTDYCRWRVDIAMLEGIRVETRHKRIDRAAQLVVADLLMTYSSEPGAKAKERLRDVARAVAAATFVAEAEEAQRGGDEDMIAREEYATALSVIAATLKALPTEQRRLFVLHYQDGKPLSHIKTVLQKHQHTLERWRVLVLAAIRTELEKRDILHAPGRGGGPRLYVLSALREPEDEVPEGEDEEGEEGEEDEEEPPG
jgi:RNA polymerase sigma factor (sigma-70 family)